MNMLDKETAEKKMFTFEDIRKLDNRAIIEVLKAVDKNTLIIALKGAPDDIKERL